MCPNCIFALTGLFEESIPENQNVLENG